MRRRGLWMAAFPLLLLLAGAQSSWAWRGRWGWHGRWWWPGVGLYAASAPYWDYPYPYYWDPYYYPPYAYGLYEPYPASSTGEQAPENRPSDPKARHAQAVRERAQVEYDYADGDITAAERDARLREIDEEEKNPPAAKSTPAQPAVGPAGRRDLSTVTDLHLELRTLLDQKLKEGNITQAQHAAEAKYLDQIDQEAHAAASANRGALTADQERAFVQQLHKAYYAINHNLISHD